MTEVPTYRPREYLSISTLLSFARCPRKYMYEKMGLESRESSVTALVYGTAMHKAIPYAIAGDPKRAFEEFQTEWDEQLANKTRSLASAQRNLAHCAFTHQRGALFDRLELPPEIPGVRRAPESTNDYEIAFAIDVGLPIPIGGRIDGWCKHRDDGTWWGYEFKTTSRLNASFFEGFQMNPQVLTYALVLDTISDHKIEGVMVEGMLCHATKVDSMVSPVRIQPHHLEAQRSWLRYYGNLLLACEEKYQAAYERGTEYGAYPAESYFPQNFAGCSPYPWFYMSGFSCDFQPLCLADDFRHIAPMFNIKPPHEFIELSVKGGG